MFFPEKPFINIANATIFENLDKLNGLYWVKRKIISIILEKIINFAKGSNNRCL